jgi:hypothetical protein
MTKLLLAAALSLFQAAQTPGPQAATGSIEGIVLDDMGNPLAGAEITAFWSPPPTIFQPANVPRTTSASNGRFVLSNLAPGGYKVSVRANGFAPQEYRQESSENAVLTITAGITFDGILIRLARSGSITGIVVSSSGEPLVGIEVYALRPAYDSFGSKYVAAASNAARTNDRGEYRITSLPPGRYYVRAASDPIMSDPNRDNSRIAATLGRSAVSPGIYETAYYPREKDPSGATLLDIQSGSELTGVDFSLVRLQTYRVSGRVVDSQTGNPPVCPSRGNAPPGAPAPLCVSLVIRPLHADFISGISSSSTSYQPNGRFELAGATTGAYVVTAQLPGIPLTPEQRRLLETPSAEAPQLPSPPRGAAVVDVRDADVDDVQLTIVRDLSLSGQVTIENSPPRQLPGGEMVKVGIVPITAGQSGRPLLKAPDLDGGFRYSNMVPSEYRLKVEGLPDDVFVESARLGSVDALNEVIALFVPSPDPLNIVLNPRGGRIQGRIVDSMGNPLGNKTAVLIPNTGRTRSVFYKTATTDAAGQFVMRGITPGDYKVFAWDEIEANQFFDGEFIRKFEEDGSPVRVAELSTITVEVRIIPTKSRD